MAITLTLQPLTDAICSTLIPITFKALETSTSTTNLIARCYHLVDGGSDQQVGGDFRLAPTLGFTGLYYFDCSEIFNTITKYTLDDMPDSIKVGKADLTFSETKQTWDEVATYVVYVNFYIESVDSNGLISVDWDNPLKSNEFVVHEGSPEQEWLASPAVNNNGEGTNGSVFDLFNMKFEMGKTNNRFLTNYPISGFRPSSEVTLKKSESYLLAYFAHNNSPNVGYQTEIKTYGAGGLLNTHTNSLSPSLHYQTILCGWHDLFASAALTANAAEGGGFVNVTSYIFQINAGTTSSGGSEDLNSTIYNFTIDTSCKGKGYMRFCFKNMVGGYDMVTSDGAYIEKTKTQFEKFERTQGYFDWDEPMYFGATNWAGSNVKQYSVTTHNLKKEYAQHFAEMFMSTQG